MLIFITVMFLIKRKIINNYIELKARLRECGLSAW